jgi:hypothetical protein
MKAFDISIKFTPATVAEGWQFIVRVNGTDRMVWNGRPLQIPAHDVSADAASEKR